MVPHFSFDIVKLIYDEFRHHILTLGYHSIFEHDCICMVDQAEILEIFRYVQREKFPRM